MALHSAESPASTDRDVTGPRSLRRVLGMFHVLSRAPQGMALSELSETLNTPKSSLLNLLRPLVADGYLVHENGQYRLAGAAFRLCAGVQSAWNFSKVVRPFMEELSSRTQETVLLGVVNRDAGVVTYIEVIDSPHPVRYQITAGTTRQLYVSTAGRLLLAYSPPDWLEEYLSTVSIRAKTTPITKSWLRKSLVQGRREGVVWAIDHYLEGLASVAAPLLDSNGRCLASLSIAGPSNRFKADLGKMISSVQDVARRASGVVGAVHVPVPEQDEPSV
ncbi:MAG: transcriptional regulator, IclR family [Ramlibacter sp.]|jgi:DNA-binding IclR family transcriptional regulator|nr:transcriptional regulator, IclR family [Ramlibacter sp.]